MRKEYSQAIVDKIYSYTSISTKDKIDRLLEIDACQYTNLGKDSTVIEKDIVRQNSQYIYNTIKKIDKAMGINFLQHQDK